MRTIDYDDTDTFRVAVPDEDRELHDVWGLMWTSKIGVEGKKLRMGLKDNETLVAFADMTDPMLVMRKRDDPDGTAISQTVTEYTDEPTLYNCEVEFDFADMTPGVYVCEVQTVMDSEDVTFPSNKYFLLRFLEALS